MKSDLSVFRLEPAYDATGNSPWDAVRYEGSVQDLDILDCEMKLGPIWRPPQIQIEKRRLQPDIYVCHVHYVVTSRVRELFGPLFKETAEFLPVLAADMTLFLLHSFRRIELDDRAEVTRNKASGNITVIRKYSFRENELEDDADIFQVRQAIGSNARDGGFPCSGLLVSRHVKNVCDANQIQGVVLRQVFGPKK